MGRTPPGPSPGLKIHTALRPYTLIVLALESLRPGVDVISKDGKKLGVLRRVVLKRKDLTLTDIVVDIGFLRSGRPLWAGGFGLDYDRIVPVDHVVAVEAHQVRLDVTADEFAAMPAYSEERFEQPRDLSPNEFDLPDVVNRAHALAGMIANTGAFWTIEKLNRPEDAIDIKEGTDVWRQDPHHKLGEVDRVLLDDEGRVKAFVVRRGLVLKRDVVLPVRYICELFDDLIRVDISDEELERLQEYRAG